MPKQTPEERVSNFFEVAKGYTVEMAVEEAERCLQCKNPQCRKGCPVGIDIPAFIKLIKEGRYVEAAWKIKETNSLPAICGRVCPQETQCEEVCTVKKASGVPVAIGNLERFVSDYERLEGSTNIPTLPPPTGKKGALL